MDNNSHNDYSNRNQSQRTYSKGYGDDWWGSQGGYVASTPEPSYGGDNYGRSNSEAPSAHGLGSRFSDSYSRDGYNSPSFNDPTFG